MENVRKTALTLLGKCADAEQYSNLALDTAIKRGDFSPADRGLLTSLVYGTLERLLTLDYQIERLSSRPLSELDAETKSILRLGLYQLLYLDRVPDHAAVNETVELAPRRTRGFVNAILRELLRREKRLELPDATSEPMAYLSVKYSFAEGICAAFVEEFGMLRAESILSAFCTQPPLTLRVNTLKISRAELKKKIAAAGFEAHETTKAASGLLLASAPVRALPGFDDGWFFVQDEASQLCVEALDAQPGMTLLDACACPGSKSFGAAIEMENRGCVISCDLHKNKLSLVQDGAARLGISIIETEARDARTERDEWKEKFDRVLCDVPCSGFGVFAKKPELRYKEIEKSAALPDIQLAILENAARMLAPGGRLVYSTCTLLHRENGGNIQRFLQAHPDFTLLRERTLYPDIDSTDGFYFAVLARG